MIGRTMQPNNGDLIREREAEWEALPLMLSANFKQVLDMANIPPELVIQHPGVEPIKLKCGQISNERTWKKFLASTGQQSAPRKLIGVGEKLAVLYKQWFLTDFTPRYRIIKAEADLAWLEQVVTIAVKRFVMVNKYEAYMCQQPQAFASPLVAIAMMILMKLRDLEEETPRMIHHIVKEPELREELMKEHLDEFKQVLQEGWPLMLELPPPLSQGMIGPSHHDAEGLEQQKEEEGGEAE